MHNTLLDSTLPFCSGPGAEGKETRAGSSLASVFHASGAEAWQSLPWLYLGQTVRFFWCKMHAPECFCFLGISSPVEDLLHIGDMCDTLWGVTLQSEWRGMGWAGDGGSSEHP